MKCIIVDDEIMARKSLENLCSKIEGLTVCGVFEEAKSALEKINQEEIDLILLDIEMPNMSGLELINSLPYLPQIIFTTSNKEYAFEAYEYDVTDFLKKPISYLRLNKAIEKVISKQNRLNTIASHSAQTEIYVKHNGRFVRVSYKSILYFENVGDYIRVVTKENSYVFHGTIKRLDEHMAHPRFLKVHRSFIVNLDKIVDIEDNSLVINEKVIPISRAHKPHLMRSINFL